MKGLKAAVLVMSFLQMATNAIASVLADIAAQFPDVSAAVIQYLMTFPNLLVVVMSVVTAKLSVIFPKKWLASVGLFLGAAAGICSFLFHGSIVLLFVWAGFLGCGIGLVVPVAMSLISDYFCGNEKDELLGYQTSAANIGSMLMTFVGGILASLGWQYNYLVYLLAVPGLLLTLLFVPSENVSGAEKKEVSKKLPGGVWFYFCSAALFMMLFYVAPTNLSMLVEERGLGGTVVSGAAATILLLGGTAMGLIFGKISSRIGKYTILLGFLTLTAGYLMIFFAGHIALLFAGSFIVGTGNTLVLPQCMGSVVTEDKEQSTFLMSAAFATANLGTFAAPLLTSLSAVVMGDDSAASRILFAGIAALPLALITGFFLYRRERRQQPLF